MKRLALVASFCGITITQMMAQNINGEQISDTTLFDKFSKELGEVVVKAHLPQYKKTHEGLLTNVAGTVLGKMGTAEDVLKHVPSIVKKKDGYEVVGKSIHPICAPHPDRKHHGGIAIRVCKIQVL